MHVPVQQTGNQMATVGLHQDRVIANCMAGVFPDVSDPLAGDSDVGTRQNLTRLDTDPATSADDQVGGPATHCHLNELFGIGLF